MSPQDIEEIVEKNTVSLSPQPHCLWLCLSLPPAGVEAETARWGNSPRLVVIS